MKWFLMAATIALSGSAATQTLPNPYQHANGRYSGMYGSDAVVTVSDGVLTLTRNAGWKPWLRDGMVLARFTPNATPRTGQPGVYDFPATCLQYGANPEATWTWDQCRVILHHPPGSPETMIAISGGSGSWMRTQ